VAICYICKEKCNGTGSLFEAHLDCYLTATHQKATCCDAPVIAYDEDTQVYNCLKCGKTL